MLNVLVASVLMIISMHAMAKVWALGRKQANDVRGLTHFQSVINSMRLALSHEKSCKRVFNQVDLSSIKDMTLNSPAGNPVFEVMLNFGENVLGSISAIPTNNVAFTSVALREKDVTKREVCGGQITYGFELSANARKVEGYSVGLNETTLVYLTTDLAGIVSSCSFESPSLNRTAIPPLPVQCVNNAGTYALLDVFADGNTAAFTDGDAILAFITGVPITPFIPATNNRLNPIKYIESIISQLDIDGDGKVAKNDGDMILAYEFGLTQAQIMAFASPTATRNGAQVQSYLNVLAQPKVPCSNKGINICDPAPTDPAAEQCARNPGAFSVLDVFADGTLHPFTDGDAILAFISGVPITPFVPTSNNRMDPEYYIRSILPQLDVDGNGKVEVADANMILGYEFSVTPAQIMSFAASNSTRNQSEVMTYLNDLAANTLSCSVY